jgi:hypothetical protein
MHPQELSRNCWLITTAVGRCHNLSKVRVIARHMDGQSNRQIAREEQVDSETGALMSPDDLEVSEACEDLGKFLAETHSRRDRQMIELLADMRRDGALAFRWDARSGFPIRLWYPMNPDAYADRIFPIRDDFPALLAELFLLGKIEFATRTVPPLVVEWYERVQQPTAPSIM